MPSTHSNPKEMLVTATYSFRLAVGMLLVIATLPIAKSQEPTTLLSEPAALETLDTETFDIAHLNKRLRDEAGMSPEQSRTWLETRARNLIGGAAEGESNLEEPSILGVDLEDGKSMLMSLDGNGRGVLVVGDKLMIVGLRSDFHKVDEMLKTFSQFGIRQIVIRTHVFRDTADAMKAMPINWSHVEAASKIAQSDQTSRVVPVAHEQPRTAAARMLQRQLPAFEELLPPAGVTSATWTEASSIVERATPVLYTLLAPAEYQSVLDYAKNSATIQRVMSPSVVVFNGQVASISDSIERPFVTGITPVLVGPEGKQQVEFTPNIKVYPEGTTMKIRPEIFEGRRVRLNCKLDLCKVRSVETLEIPSLAGRNDFTVQMPEVASTQFRTCLDMPLNYTLAVSTFETDELNVKRSIVILCQCMLRDLEATQ
jgi:hypothetical protein